MYREMFYKTEYHTCSTIRMMTSSNGNIFRGQRWIPLKDASDVFNGGLTKRLSKQSRRRWFETSSPSLWRHCNDVWHCRVLLMIHSVVQSVCEHSFSLLSSGCLRRPGSNPDLTRGRQLGSLRNHSPVPGPRFTNGFSVAIQIRWKFRFTLT